MKSKFTLLCASVLLSMVMGASTFAADRQSFDKSKDLLLAQYDLRPDEDDVQSAAALASMLRHDDLVGVKYYAVAGAYGKQDSPFISPVLPDFFNLCFGAQNEFWTDAHNDRNGSINRVKSKIKSVIDNGGKVFIAEGGQSDFTHDVLQSLITDGMSASTFKTKIILVQHSYRNEADDMSTISKLNWVKSNTDYNKIDDGNRNDNDTPGYKSTSKTHMENALSSSNPNKAATIIWTAADDICVNFTSTYENPAIAAGGLDYSDHSEVWWILDQGTTAFTVPTFWERYVTNSSGIVEGPGIPEPPKSEGGYKYGENFIVFEAEVTESNLGEWVLRTPDDSEYKTGKSGMEAINGTYLEFTGNNPSVGTAKSPLTYKFTAPKTASYRLSARMMQNLKGAANDKCNDAYIRLTGDFETGGSYTTEDLKQNQKFYGRGLDTWGNMYKGELENGWQQPIVYKLKAGQEYTFTVSGRAQRTCIDYFILFETSISFKGLGEPSSGGDDIAKVNDAKYRPDEINLTDCNSLRAVDFNKYTGIDGYADAEIDNRDGKSILSVPEALKTSVAQYTYKGKAAKVIFKVNAMLETDGESTYKVFVNGQKIGEATNPRIHGTSISNYTIKTHQINYVQYPLNYGDLISVEFNNVTNGLIPEAGSPVGTATARGRWYSLDICAEEVASPFPTFVDSITVSLSKATISVGESAPVEVTVHPENASNTDVLFESTDTTIAKVIDGNIIGKKPGVAAIKVSAKENGSITKIIAIEVVESTSSQHLIDYDRTGMSVIYVSSENSDMESRTHLGAHVLDGNIETKWHTQWKPSLASYPHEIWFDLGDTIHLDRLDYLPRHEGINGMLKDYEVYVSNDTSDWGDAAKVGTLSWGTTDINDETLREIRSITLNSTAHTRYVRLVALSEINGNPWASMAEMYFKAFFDNIEVSVQDTITEKGANFSLEATLNPINDQVTYPVTWASSNTSVATVTASGEVSCVDNGVAYVIASVLDGAIADTCIITVMAEGEAIVSMLNNQLDLAVDSSINLTAVAIPDTCLITWSSDANSVASVDQSGNVTALTTGNVNIIASIKGGTIKDTCSITVVSPSFNIVKKADSMLVGEVLIPEYNILPNNGKIIWSSSNTSVAEVINGTIIALMHGEAEIYANAMNGSFRDTITITSIQPQVSIERAGDSLQVGEQITLNATAIGLNEALTWFSSDTNIATVAQTGTVTAKKKGPVTISAIISKGNYSAFKNILVVSPEVDIIIDSETLYPSETFPLTAFTYPDTATVSWSSSDNTKASVDKDGLVTAISEGSVIITASIMGGAYADDCAINIVLPSVNITTESVSIDSGKTTKLTAEATEGEVVSWSSKATTIATVDGSGNVRGIKPGTTLIYASIMEGSYIDSCTVTIKEVIKESDLSNDKLSNIALYPNPTNGSFQIKGVDIEVHSVDIIDLQGRILHNVSENINGSIDISNLKNGMYLVVITGAYSTSQVLRILKE